MSNFDRLRFSVTAIIAGFAVVASAQQEPAKSFETRVSEATALYKAGKMTESVAAFEKLHQENGRSSDVQAWLGFLYLRTDRASAAVPLLESASLSRRYDLEVQNNLGNAYMATGQDEKALAIFDQIRKQDGSMFEPLYNSGVILLRQKNFKSATERLLTAATLKPDDPFVRNNLGISYENQGDLPKAAACFAKASELRPENEVFARNAGLLYARLRKYTEAIPFLETSVKLNPDATQTRATLAEAYSQTGDTAAAIGQLEETTRREPQNAVAWFNLAVLKETAKDEKGAETAYLNALKIDPSDLDTLNNYGLMQMRRARWKEAQVTFTKLAGLNPGSIDTQQNLGACAAKAGDFPAAVAAWKKVVRAEPNRSNVRLDLANALWLANDYDGAFYHFKLVVAKNPKSAEAYNGIGLYWMQKEQFAQAEAAFRSAIEARKEFVPGYNNLAIILERMHQRPKAIKVLEDGLKIAPEDPLIRQTLTRMRSAGGNES